MGGYAMKGEGVQPITRKDIPKVIGVMAMLAGIPESAFHPVGSTGKYPVSNDVDLAIDSNQYPTENVHATLSARLSGAAQFNPGTGVGSYAVPASLGIPRTIRKAQVDLMFTPNLNWATFAYHSPEFIHSDYKGAVRTMLLMGVATQVNEKGIDYFGYHHTASEKLLTVRIGRTFDLNNGLRRIYQYRPERKDGNGYLKSMKSATLEEIKSQIPGIDVTDEDIVIDDPKQALELMFNRSVDPLEVDDAESVLRLIHSSFTAEQQDCIFKNTANRAKSVKDKMKFPAEIRRYL